MKPKLTFEQELELIRQVNLLESIRREDLHNLYRDLLRNYLLSFNLNRVHLLLSMGVSETDDMITRYLDTTITEEGENE